MSATMSRHLFSDDNEMPSDADFAELTEIYFQFIKIN